MKMRAMWVKVFLNTFALQLTLSVQYEFGDLIAFDRKSPFKQDVTAYIHWAVYVGKGKIEGLEWKKPDEDIFHITGYVPPKGSDCIFDKMSDVSGEPRKFNYLDQKLKVRSKEEMIQVIRELHKNCGYWDPLMNNCEHLVTYIRYGEKHFEQIGAQAASLCKLKLPTFKYPVEKKKKGAKRSLSSHLENCKSGQC
ncbi:phospholipase A and acyltransferase 4-like [Myxocyprinus asiaticus]|uniref:phospholipase A and acyltransferase 4-like n=1 Tax=Myxocyprinus asiaticus TaxID=70543 RepID=UPI00222308FB|nr:phospholipase A and acyltransferase 4-like [Myxocyprinus asiaticus]